MRASFSESSELVASSRISKRGTPQQRARERQSLTFAPRHEDPAIADDGVEAVRKGRHEYVGGRQRERMPELVFRRLGSGPEQVGAHGVVQQERLLRDISNLLSPRVEAFGPSGTPSTRMAPSDGTSSPMIRSASVVLPDPDGPTIAVVAPAASDRLMFFRTTGVPDST